MTTYVLREWYEFFLFFFQNKFIAYLRNTLYRICRYSLVEYFVNIIR
jgi:hypothetical protein